ncbi:MAG: hypothetical protein WBI06_12040 [Paludibacter sp.]
METIKSIYIAPDVERILIDNEISLALESELPPFGPDETMNTANFNNANPFKLTNS